MSFAATAALGAMSGLTIVLGLPVSRWGRLGPRSMSFLTAASVGVLLFVFYDVIRNASQAVEAQMSSSTVAGAAYGLLLAAGLAAGLSMLVAFESFSRRRRAGALPAGPGAMVLAAVRSPVGGEAAALRTALFIALGIGLHNFSEGLAIGQTGAAGAYRFFLVLVIGFGLHNITEGFGISGPLLGHRPSWRFLGLLGLIGGGPTFLGTLIGYSVTSTALSVLFLALAAGAIVYVVGELQHVGRKLGSHAAGMAGLLCGFLAGLGTDLLLTSLGA